MTKFIPCIRDMCEAEEGWHLSSSFVPLPVSDLSPNISSYLSRIMNILKNGSISNQMNIFNTEEGSNLMNLIEKNSSADDNVVPTGYIDVRDKFIEAIENDNIFSLASFHLNDDPINKLSLDRCELKNHKVLWLCKNHSEKLNAKVLNENSKETAAINETAYRILEVFDNLNMESFNKI